MSQHRRMKGLDNEWHRLHWCTAYIIPAAATAALLSRGLRTALLSSLPMMGCMPAPFSSALWILVKYSKVFQVM